MSITGLAVYLGPVAYDSEHFWFSCEGREPRLAVLSLLGATIGADSRCRMSLAGIIWDSKEKSRSAVISIGTCSSGR